MSTGNELVTLKQVNDYYKDLRKRSAPVIFNSAIGNPAVFSDGADGLPIQSLKVHLLPRQEGSGDPSPENIRSFIPWTGVKVWNGRENLLDEANVPAANRYIKYTSPTNAQWNASADSRSYKMEVEPNTTYTVRALNPAITMFRVCALENGDLQEYSTNAFQWDGTGERVCTITTSATEHYLIIQINRAIALEKKGYIFVGNGTAEENPITETDIVFDSPVCGGFIDTYGNVFATHVLWTKNTANMDNESIYPGWKNAGIRDIVGTEKGGAINDSINVGNVFAINTRNANDIVYLPLSEYGKEQDEWKALSIDVQIAMPLETPVLIATLDPIELRTLLGKNTIWSDANGNIELEYRADTELFIEQNTVKDVQINGVSILNDKVANIPPISSNGLGLARSSNSGIQCNSSGQIFTKKASSAELKEGSNSYNVVVPNNQHESAFYALAKLAGADMAQSSNPVGTFTDAAKAAIQKLFGFDGIFGDYELSATASKAYAVGETFIFNGNRYRATSAIAINDVLAPGTNCELDPIDEHYVRFTDKAGASTPGVVRIDPNFGVGHRDAPNEDVLMVQQASQSEMKSGYGPRKPIVPSGQHTAVYYALAKLAGADMASLTGETVGVYPQAQKTAIQTMLGIEADIPLVETVTGATASITGMPNVRYICDTAISELTITPPASGSIVVRFTAGSNCIMALPQTVKLPEWFDISSLEAGTTYEIIITDGVYGGVMSWA